MAKFDYSGIVETSLAGRAPIVEPRKNKNTETSDKNVEKQISPEPVAKESPKKEQKTEAPKKETYELKAAGIKLEGKKKRKKLTRSVYIYDDLYSKLAEISNDTNLSISDVLNKILDQVL